MAANALDDPAELAQGHLERADFALGDRPRADRDQHEASDGSRAGQTGSSLDLEDVDIFLATPLGKHLSAFLEFPLFETHAEAKDGPTGPAEANNTVIASRRDIQFTTESPAFEMGKLIWNDLLPDAILPTDSFNIEAGVDQLPTPFSAEANRLSVNPYLIYRRRALDLLSPTPVGTLLVGNEGDRLLRLVDQIFSAYFSS